MAVAGVELPAPGPGAPATRASSVACRLLGVRVAAGCWAASVLAGSSPSGGAAVGVTGTVTTTSRVLTISCGAGDHPQAERKAMPSRMTMVMTARLDVPAGAGGCWRMLISSLLALTGLDSTACPPAAEPNQG